MQTTGRSRTRPSSNSHAHDSRHQRENLAKAPSCTPAGQGRYLLGGFAIAAERNGLLLGPNDVYDFTIPPILGGKFDIGNIKVMYFVVSLNLGGQLLAQVKSVPPWTQISGFTVEGQ